jgi:hypothetical protein
VRYESFGGGGEVRVAPFVRDFGFRSGILLSAVEGSNSCGEGGKSAMGSFSGVPVIKGGTFGTITSSSMSLLKSP